MIARLRAAASLLTPREFALAARPCPFCGPSLLVRLRNDEIATRCIRCGASAVHLSIGWALRENVANLSTRDACELSARGPLVAYLRRHAKSVATSEFFADVAPGASRDGVRCEDVQKLTYVDGSFDLFTHTEVFEHVPDDAAAFAQLHRVLRPNGLLIFTVPLSDSAMTIERVASTNGNLEYLLPPEYHTDPLRSGSRILVYRDYGTDIVDRVRRAGFSDVRLLAPPRQIPWNLGRRVVVAMR